MRKRNKEILIWLSDKDFRKLEKDRKAAGQTRQEYILGLVHSLPLVRCPKPDIERAREVLGNDGRLINEITHRFNATGQININEYVSAVNTLHGHMMLFEKEIESEIRRLDDEERSETQA